MVRSMRRFHVRFRINEGFLQSFPSYGVDRFLQETYEHALVFFDALAQLPNIQIVISWRDTLHMQKFEGKKWVLNALKVLPRKCAYKTGDVQSASNDVSVEEFSAYLDSVMGARDNSCTVVQDD